MNSSKKGSALIISILLMAVIATASFGIARWALIELSSGQIQQANIKAYYLAEAGIEEGLLRWRYNHQVETPAGSHQYNNDGIDGRKWQISNLSSGNVEQLTGAANLDDLNQSEDHTALTIYNRVTQAWSPELQNHANYGIVDQMTAKWYLNLDDVAINSIIPAKAFFADFQKYRPDLYVKKDNKIVFSLEKSSTSASVAKDLDLVWNWQQVAAPGAAQATATWGSDQQKYGVVCSYGACLQGDINKNGRLDSSGSSSDASKILSLVVNPSQRPTNPFDYCMYDVNNSRDMATNDYTGDSIALTRQVVGLDPLTKYTCAPKYGIEIRLYQKIKSGVTSGDKLLAKKVFTTSGGNNSIEGAEQVPSCNDNSRACEINNIKAALHYSVDSVGQDSTYITVTPLGANIILTAFGTNGMSNDLTSREFIDSVSHIESVGVSNGRTKGLEVKIDQNSGNVLGLFDYVLYQGGK